MSRQHKAKNTKADSDMVVIESATSSQVEQALKDGHMVAKEHGEYYIFIKTGKNDKTSKNIKADSDIVVIESATSSQVEQALKDGHKVAKKDGEYYIFIETGKNNKASSSSSSTKK